MKTLTLLLLNIFFLFQYATETYGSSNDTLNQSKNHKRLVLQKYTKKAGGNLLVEIINDTLFVEGDYLENVSNQRETDLELPHSEERFYFRRNSKKMSKNIAFCFQSGFSFTDECNGVYKWNLKKSKSKLILSGNFSYCDYLLVSFSKCIILTIDHQNNAKIFVLRYNKIRQVISIGTLEYATYTWKLIHEKFRST